MSGILSRGASEIDEFLRCNLLLLFVISNLLKSEEIFSALLIQLLLNVTYSEFNSGDDDIFKGVDSSVGDFNDLIKSDELGLK